MSSQVKESAQLLIRSIEKAFADVDRPSTSLRQFKLTDQKGMAGDITAEEWATAGRNRTDRSWQEIPEDEIEECSVLLAHMEAPEFTYYLPAYMCYSLRNYTKPIWESDILGMTVFSLYPSSNNKHQREYRLSQLSLLNSDQKSTVIQFLTFVSECADLVQRPEAKAALDRYWIQHAHE